VYATRSDPQQVAKAAKVEVQQKTITMSQPRPVMRASSAIFARLETTQNSQNSGSNVNQTTGRFLCF
jgi:hypothetical protein